MLGIQSGHASSKIKQLEDVIQEMHAKTHIYTEWIETLITNRQELTIQLIFNKLQRGWELVSLLNQLVNQYKVGW